MRRGNLSRGWKLSVGCTGPCADVCKCGSWKRFKMEMKQLLEAAAVEAVLGLLAAHFVMKTG